MASGSNAPFNGNYKDGEKETYGNLPDFSLRYNGSGQLVFRNEDGSQDTLQLEKDGDLQVLGSDLEIGDEDGSIVRMKDTGSDPASEWLIRNGAGFLAIRENGNDRLDLQSGGKIRIPNGDLDLSGNSITDGSGNSIYDSSAGHVPLSILESSSLTVAGNNVELGGSTSVSHSDLDNISSDQHHRKGMSKPERQSFNDQQAAMARLQFENNLSELGFDGGFLDIFRDESKIVDATQIALKTLDSGNTEGIAEILENLGTPNNLIETLKDATDDVNGVSLSSSYLAVVSDDNNIYVYDTDTFTLQETLTDSTDNRVYCVSLSSSYLAVGTGYTDGDIYVYDTDTFTLQETLTDATSTVYDVSLSSSYLAAGSDDNNIYVYDTDTFTLQETLTDSTDGLRGVSLSSSYLAAGNGDSDTYVYDTDSFTLQETLTDATDFVFGVSLSSSYLAVGSSDNDTYVYDTDTFTLQETLTDATNAVYGVSLSSSYLAAGSDDNNTYVYDTDTFTLQETLTDSTDSVRGVSLSSSYLAVGSDDNNTYVYERPSEGFYDSGTITFIQKDLASNGFSNPPNSLVLSQAASFPANTDIQYTVEDADGNTVSITQSEVDSIVDTSNFTSNQIQVKATLSQSTTNDDATPTLDDIMVHFQEG